MRLLLHVAIASLLPFSTSLRAQDADLPNTFSSDELNLRLTYPPELERHPPTEAIAADHLRLLGLAPAPGETAGSIAACLRPLFLAETPAPSKSATTAEHPSADGSSSTVTITPARQATMLLAELDTTCLSGAEQASRRKELPAMAQQFLSTPGMAAVAQPASYTIGSQKVYMAAAQGHPRSAPAVGADSQTQPASSPFTLFTLAIATNWNNHLLVWLLTSNQTALLDTLSKSPVRFGRAAAAPLYPLPLGNASPTGSPQ